MENVSVVKYREQVKREVYQIKTELEIEDTKNELIDLVVKNSKIYEDINERIDKQFLEIKKSYETYAKVNGVSYEEILKQYNTDELKMKNHVEQNIKQDIVIDAIIKKEKISIDKLQLEKLEMDYVSEYGYNSIEEFIEDCGEDYLDREVKREFIKDFLYENAKIETINN